MVINSIKRLKITGWKIRLKKKMYDIRNPEIHFAGVVMKNWRR